MKFDFVIGNPPYQENIDNRGEQPPVYDKFYDASEEISNNIYYITPARFLFDAGKTSSEWNKKMLNNEHFKVLNYYSNSKDVFYQAEIKGGVAISCINKDKHYEPIEMFVKYDELRNILEKVKKISKDYMSSIMYSNTSYRYDKLFFEENPDFINRVSGGSKRYLSSSVFNKFPEAFSKNKPDSKNEYIEIIGRKDNKRVNLYFRRDYLNPPENFMDYKVFLASSNGSGIFGETLSEPIIGEPCVGATETFISFGKFDNINVANNLIKYIKSKFMRAILGCRKVTQGNKNIKIWSVVPLQDFTDKSDIDWTVSISEIDKQLYKKYNLSESEIEFIETNVKEMV